MIQITHVCIQEAVNKQEAHEFVHRFMLSLLLQVKGDSNAAQALEDVEKACGIVAAHPSLILDKNSSSACRSVSVCLLNRPHSCSKQLADPLDRCGEVLFAEKMVTSNTTPFG